MTDREPLPPGTLLQLMYLRRRLGALPAGRFVEIGCGRGTFSRPLLERGWTGIAYEQHTPSAVGAEHAFAAEIQQGRWSVRARDWLAEFEVPRADLLLSAMVLEHLDERQVTRYFEQADRALAAHGLGVLLVPASPAHWGIEDEVAGHRRRYTRATLRQAVEAGGFRVVHLVGLTYPVSNLLLRLSNHQVGKWERSRTELSQEQRTHLSGCRDVPWKTSFPRLASLALNERLLLPLHGLQLLGRGSSRALVLYCEFARAASSVTEVVDPRTS